MSEQEINAESDKLELVGFEFEKVDSQVLPSGQVRYLASLGDTRKSTTSVWGKKIDSIDISQKGGYAFIGTWLKRFGERVELIMNNKDLAVVIYADGSWKHPHCQMHIYLCLNNQIYRTYTKWSNLEGDKQIAIYDVAEILEEVKKL